MSIFDHFPYSNTHQLNLDWIISQVKKLSVDYAELHKDFSAAKIEIGKELDDLKNYVNDQLSGLDVAEEVSRIIDRLAASGELAEIVEQSITNFVQFDFIGNRVVKNPAGGYFSDGTGDCCLVTFKNRHYLVDCFHEYSMREIAIPYLKARGIAVIDGVFLTHYHSDHYGGIQALINSGDVSVSKYYLPPAPDFTQPFFGTPDTDYIETGYNYVMQIISSAGAAYEFVNSGIMDLGDGLRLKVFNTDYTPYYQQILPRPEGTGLNYSDEGVYADYNNMSVCYQFEYQNYKALFSGDIGYSAMTYLLPVVGKVDIWNINHHGHNNYIVDSFYSKISPDVAVFQDTYNQYFEDPFTSKVASRIPPRYLKANNVDVYGTLGNTVTVTMGRNGVNVVQGDSHNDYSIFKYYGEQFRNMFNKFGDFAYPLPEKRDANECVNGLFRLPSGSTNVPVDGLGYLLVDFTDIQWNEIRYQIAVEYGASVSARIWARAYAENRGGFEPWYTVKGEKQLDIAMNEQYFSARTAANRLSYCGGVACLHIYSKAVETIPARTSTAICTIPEFALPWGIICGVVLVSTDNMTHYADIFLDSSGVAKLWCDVEIPANAKVEGSLTFIPRY